MFATLLGALPWPDGLGPHEVQRAVAAAVGAQDAAGLEPITDGRLADPAFDLLIGRLTAQRRPPGTVDAWRLVASLTSRPAKQALPGPYSIARRAVPGESGRHWAERREIALDVAALIRAEVEALAAAGCPLVEIEETEAHAIGGDRGEREIFAEAHGQLADGVAGTHLTLSIVGGSAWGAGIETIGGAPYASLAVDLIAGADNWNLVTRLPRERGVIAGVLPAHDSPAEARETLLWAARYAAASRRRGLARVGLGSAGSWADLTWVAALRKLEALGEAARLAATPAGEELARSLDPRAVSARAAALGHVAPRRRGNGRRPHGSQHGDEDPA